MAKREDQPMLARSQFNQSLKSGAQTGAGIVFWHRELPPSDAEQMGEHVVEVTSTRTPSTLAHRDELWDRYYKDLMIRASAQLEQEVIRRGGNYAHVLDECVDSRHDAATGESWLHGRFTYVLYRNPRQLDTPPISIVATG
jgi:hypothetical protein